ncbi:MAG: cation:proton antiporter [Candidatus Woesearchaeota archaeon]
MISIILFLAGVFLITFLLGRVLEKFRIPWIFSALLIGLGLAAYNPFKEITSSSDFLLLSNLGMYFLLFIIGFELDIKRIFKSGKFIVKTTAAIILSEALVASILLHYVFDLSWMISVLLSLSFATVGEAVLLPILDEFRLTKTKLGQTILAIGVLDDVIEIATVVAVSVLLGYSAGHTTFNIWINLLILFSLFALVFIIIKLRKYLNSFKYKDIPSFFFVVMFFLFLFVGLGEFVESAALGALLAGIALKNIIPPRILEAIESEIKTLAYGFLAPIFFLWVGLDVNITYILKYPLLILLFTLVTYGAKAISSYTVARSELGQKQSVILGISLCVRLSTSIVIIKLLFVRGLINSEIYSILIGTQLIFKFIIPFALSYLITKWKISGSRSKKISTA